MFRIENCTNSHVVEGSQTPAAVPAYLIQPSINNNNNNKKTLTTLTPPSSGLTLSRVIGDEQNSPPSEPDDLLGHKHNTANPLQAY